MAQISKEKHFILLVVVGLLAWFIPGAGHVAIKERARGAVIFVAIAATFTLGLYVGSIGVVNR